MLLLVGLCKAGSNALGPGSEMATNLQFSLVAEAPRPGRNLKTLIVHDEVEMLVEVRLCVILPLRTNLHPLRDGVPIPHGLQTRRSPLDVDANGLQRSTRGLRRNLRHASLRDDFIPMNLSLAFRRFDDFNPGSVELPDVVRRQLLPPTSRLHIGATVCDSFKRFAHIGQVWGRQATLLASSRKFRVNLAGV